MEIAIAIQSLSKQYKLGLVGTGSLSHDLNRFWHKIRGKEDPYLKVGAVNERDLASKDRYVWALKDINFEVETGDVVGIIGRNGAGKSTLLKVLSRVTGPTTGSIKYKGRIGALLEVGTGFHPELTGRENVYLNGAILGMTKREIEGKFDDIVDFSGCARYIDTPTKRYSSGMIVRLGFAVAAFLEPEILVVDEVLAVGDAEFQKKAVGKMQEVSQKDGRTVLFVSHNMAAVESLCRSAIILENGGIVFNGAVTEGIGKYLRSKSVDGQRIKDGIRILHPDFIVETVTVNESEYNVIPINETNHTLKIKFQGVLKEPKQLALEAFLFDSRGVIQGSFLPAHRTGAMRRCEAGPFSIAEVLTFPHNIAGGTFFLTVGLTDMRNEWYVKIPEFVRIESKGPVSRSGTEFSYSKGGLIYFD